MSRGSEKPRVVIAGAGFGGLAVARAFRKTNVRVVIVDRENHHLFQPLLYQVATAGLSPADIAAPIRSIVSADKNMEVRLGSIVGVDTGTRLVRLADGTTIPFDYLVLATGARHSYFGNDAWSAFAPGLKTIDDATLIRKRVLLALERAEAAYDDEAARDKLLTFVLIGGGPTGVEMAGAVAELTRVSVGMDFRRITPNCSRIVLIEAGPRLLASFPEKLSAIAKTSLERLGVEVRVDSKVDDVDADGIDIGGKRIASATVIWAAGVQASPAAAWLDASADRAGRVLVASDLGVPGHENIFAIGDTAASTMADGHLVPGVAPAAKQQGRFVGERIAARIAGRIETGPFRYRDYGNLATIGRKHAVADFGWITLSGTVAWLLWSTVHIFFLVGFRNRLIVGANWLWNYLTFQRGARLITGIDALDPVEQKRAPVSMPVPETGRRT